MARASFEKKNRVELKAKVDSFKIEGKVRGEKFLSSRKKALISIAIAHFLCCYSVQASLNEELTSQKKTAQQYQQELEDMLEENAMDAIPSVKKALYSSNVQDQQVGAHAIMSFLDKHPECTKVFSFYGEWVMGEASKLDSGFQQVTLPFFLFRDHPDQQMYYDSFQEGFPRYVQDVLAHYLKKEEELKKSSLGFILLEYIKLRKDDIPTRVQEKYAKILAVSHASGVKKTPFKWSEGNRAKMQEKENKS